MKKSIILASISVIFFALMANAQGYTFNSDLHIGSSGSDVVNLQTWLISNGFDIPAVSSGATGKGYFGSQTQAAVEAYQRSVGLPAYGFFGPLTRSYWSSHFGGGNNDGTSLRVISPNGGETWTKGTTQYISWTGASGYLNQTGDIKLEHALPACALPGANPRCMIAVLAPITIASGVNLNSGSYAWNVGQAVYSSCSNNVINSDGTRNACDPAISTVADGQYKIQICPTNANNSTQCAESDNNFNITSTVSNNQSPVISGIDAPTSLSINQTGTWTVHATDPLNGTLSYAVNWGDTQTTCPGGGYACLAPVQAVGFVQGSTFTHSYSTAGTYTITFAVRNNSGLTAQTSATVTVGGSNQTSNLPDINIISPNGGETWRIGTNQTFTVNITGDRTKVGPFVTASLVNSANQETIVYIGTQAVTVGIQALNAFVPPTVVAGSYRLVVRLYQTFPMTAGATSYPTASAPVLQAYDYSDNYFNISN